MRLALMLSLCLVACGSEPSPAAAPDASQPADAAPLDVAPDVAVVVDARVDAAHDVAQLDAGGDVAVTVDAPAEASAPPDAARDAGADVADPCGSAVLRQCDVNGHAECVNISSGRVLGGVVVHCGACGVTCAAGESCFARTCTRL